MQSRCVALKRLAAISSVAIPVAPSNPATTPAVTVIAPSAVPQQQTAGSRATNRNFFLPDTSIWSSRSRTNSTLLFLINPKILISILFKAVSETLSDFGRTHLHGRIGFLAVLHTWDQTLRDHFHLHCLIPGGALSSDGERWIAARSNFLFHVRALGVVFRAKFLDHLTAAYGKDQLHFPGRAAAFAQAPQFRKLLASVRKKNWVVYAKRPFSSPETVLDYLGRYTHRIAISNHRILSVKDNRVVFLYRDRKDSSRQTTMTLDAGEFIRRFLLHVLPSGLMRIRHFGFLANRCKAAQLERCRKILKVPPPAPPELSDSFRSWIADRKRCHQCGHGTLIPIRTLAARHWDSS